MPFKVTPGIRAVPVSYFIPLAFQHQGLFECSMATARGMFESRRTAPPFKPSTAVFGQRARAIRSVRDLLSQPASLQDDRALIGVMQLMGTHIITGDIVSFQSHHKAVKQMIELRGGLGDTDAHRALRGFLGMNEMFALMLKYVTSTMPAAVPARTSPSTSQPLSSTTRPPPLNGQASSLQRASTQTSSPPTIPQLKLDYPRQPFPESLNGIISKLPPGLAALSLTGTISTQTIGLLAQVAPWAALTATANPSVTVSHPDIFRLYCEPMETAKIALSILLALPPVAAAPRLDHLLCVGLCLSIRGARNQARPPALHVRLLSDFVAVVRSLMITRTTTTTATTTTNSPSLTQPEQDAVVWISFLAAYGSGHPAFQRQVDALLDLVLQTYSYGPAAREWAFVEALLRRFFWFEPLGADWRELWRQSVARMRGA
ncbi:Fungal specific transcription factor domain-containing protein isoform 1 [Cladophialophora immunda]|nr:Fungal specific transcription factor domain-containing protein isoform 1 [Cladophialophora immunda]